LYWALYTFLQSARKQQNEIAKYFKSGDQSLLNIHEEAQQNPTAGEIALTIINPEDGSKETCRISEPLHETFANPIFEKADLASDFITYRFFFGFSHFRNSEHFNLWKLFEHELLPFCITTNDGAGELESQWRQLTQRDPNPNAYRGVAGAKAFRDFNWDLRQYCKKIEAVLTAINSQAQNFYNVHFSEGDSVPLKFEISMVKVANRNPGDIEVSPPELRLIVTKGTSNITRPQSHLNEAKMTQLAISIRFAASLVGFDQAELKLLVLDDLLVSFDMDNRMRVVEILLSQTFEDCQKIVLTHDLGFFQEFRRLIGVDHTHWCFSTLNGTADQMIEAVANKTDLEIAQEFLQNGRIDECGNRLRKAVEANLTTFLDKARKMKGLDQIIDRKKFATLHSKINEAISILQLDGFNQFAELLQSNFSLEELNQIAASENIAIDDFEHLPKKTKDKLVRSLYAARQDLQNNVVTLLNDVSRKRQTAVLLLNEVKRIKERILNPASHAGTTPLYKKEAEDAIKVIQALHGALAAALPTLQP
jgi:hypothetical protein